MNKNFDLIVGIATGIYFIFLIFNLSDNDGFHEVMAWVGITLAISFLLVLEAFLKMYVLGRPFVIEFKDLFLKKNLFIEKKIRFINFYFNDEF